MSGDQAVPGFRTASDDMDDLCYRRFQEEHSKMTTVAEALDRQCVPLPRSVLLDMLWDLLERDGMPDPEDDEAYIRRSDEIYAWAMARAVRVRV